MQFTKRKHLSKNENLNFQLHTMMHESCVILTQLDLATPTCMICALIIGLQNHDIKQDNCRLEKRTQKNQEYPTKSTQNSIVQECGARLIHSPTQRLGVGYPYLCAEDRREPIS